MNKKKKISLTNQIGGKIKLSGSHSLWELKNASYTPSNTDGTPPVVEGVRRSWWCCRPRKVLEFVISENGWTLPRDRGNLFHLARGPRDDRRGLRA